MCEQLCPEKLREKYDVLLKKLNKLKNQVIWYGELKDIW